MIAIDAIDHLVINVRDVEASAAWYQQLLGMKRAVSDAGRTSVHFGVQKINLRPIAESEQVWFTADQVAAGSEDLCFLTKAEPEAVIAHLRACGVGVEKGPVEAQGARGTLRSVYCRDPDGNLIEIASYKS